MQGAILDTVDAIWFNPYRRIQGVVDSTPYLHCNIENTYSMFGKSNSYAAARLCSAGKRELFIGCKRLNIFYITAGFKQMTCKAVT